MGMLATVLNGLALQNALEQLGFLRGVMTAIEMHQSPSLILFPPRLASS